MRTLSRRFVRCLDSHAAVLFGAVVVAHLSQVDLYDGDDAAALAKRFGRSGAYDAALVQAEK